MFCMCCHVWVWLRNVTQCTPHVPAWYKHNVSTRNQLYSRLNLLIRQFSYVDSFTLNTLYSLFNTFCMSMYGSQLWNLGLPKMMEPSYIAWRKCVRRIFALPYNTHCNLLPNIAQDTTSILILILSYINVSVNSFKMLVLVTINVSNYVSIL